MPWISTPAPLTASSSTSPRSDVLCGFADLLQLLTALWTAMCKQDTMQLLGAGQQASSKDHNDPNADNGHNTTIDLCV